MRALLGTSLGSLPGFLLPFALTWRLHAGRLTDAYFLSFAIVSFVATILSNVLEVSMIPAATSHKQSGSKSLARLVRTTIRNALGVAALAYLPTAIVGAIIINTRHTWTASEKHLCILLTLIFGIYILATAVTSVLDGTLYALGQFFTPAVSQCLRTLLPLIFIMLTPRDAGGVVFTASLLVAGEIMRGAILLRPVRAKIRSLSGDGLPARPSRLLEASIPLALSLLVVAGSPLVDKVVAARLAPGSVTVIELAEKVFFVPYLALLSSVVLVAGSRWAALSHTKPEAIAGDFKRSMTRVVLLSTAAALLVGGMTAAATAISGDRFLGLNASQFSGLVLIFIAGLPGAMVISLGARLMTALQRTRLLPLFALGAFTLNLVGDIVGAHFLGVDGIALASTLFRYASAALYIWTCALLLRTMVSEGEVGVVGTPFLLR